MSLSLWRWLGEIVVWGLVLTGTLSIARLPGDWGHGVCGPWGCGPPLQALVACHLSWLVVLLPLAGVLRLWLSRHQQRVLGAIVLVIGAAGLGGMIAYDISGWWAEASEWQRPFLWQRVGFAMATQIDFPLVELVLAGIYLMTGARSTRIRGNSDGESGRQIAQRQAAAVPADSVDPRG